MKLKPGVTVTGLRPELLLALTIADRIYQNHGHDLVVTSLLDGRHSWTSLHYSGCAADLRTTAAGLAASTIEAIASDIKRSLTVDYDVVVEVDHLHVEFQPRRRD